ncbi:MAG TPA: hypothetical protein PLR32_00210 [candidate division Zixibacteria bacterium]|nr:hypothetical protein [candidate division Zixibacteria bacterium]MDD4917384.1 hypothetical protein [candidate division Zixibacteria bacterium]MDM7972382.1 hypothetical protein [candidate division Zixibacteria bacterium]HOD66186.1 hypothetical protein [candidate division Zixibacteria bacterium]HOZ08396.1 hypothetical protein [candidate division Zixibacteria bacterium]
MREHYFRTDIVVRLQRWFWWTIVLLFGAATALWAVDAGRARWVTTWGINVVFLIVAFIIVLMAELFRRARLYRYALLSYLLLVILLSTIALKLYVTG